MVAGVPELSEFDVIIDAGSDASDPESAVPFDVELPGGKVLEQPGNFFFLTETSLFGTNPEFQARGVEPDLDGDGEATFGEALPDADMVMAFTRDFAAQAEELDAAARAWEPTRADALQALVTMTPTMSEYFGQWKNSRFIAGAKADEQSSAASSRLQDIEDILSGLVLIYDTSVYREGFETTLFLQSLELSAGLRATVAGALIGLAATAAVAVVTFKLQRKLPYKRMLIVTGVLLAFVLVVIVGATVRTMQGAGWLPIHSLDAEIPYWAGTWLGVFPTVETLGAQAIALAFVVGSYFAAEYVRVKRPRRRAAVVARAGPEQARL